MRLYNNFKMDEHGTLTKNKAMIPAHCGTVARTTFSNFFTVVLLREHPPHQLLKLRHTCATAPPFVTYSEVLHFDLSIHNFLEPFLTKLQAQIPCDPMLTYAMHHTMSGRYILTFLQATSRTNLQWDTGGIKKILFSKHLAVAGGCW